MHPSVSNGRSVEKELTLTGKTLYLWLLNFKSQKQVVSVSASQGTSYRHKHKLFGWSIWTLTCYQSAVS